MGSFNNSARTVLGKAGDSTLIREEEAGLWLGLVGMGVMLEGWSGRRCLGKWKETEGIRRGGRVRKAQRSAGIRSDTLKGQGLGESGRRVYFIHSREERNWDSYGRS